MYYSAIGLLAIAVLLIENQDILFHRLGNDFSKPAWKTYRTFLFSVLVYYATDVLWGALESTGLAVPLFADTSVYFIAMAVSVAFWTRYIVTYLDEKSIFERLLLYAGRVIAVLTALITVVNVFCPIMFTVDASCVYHELGMRNAVLIIQVMLLFLVSGYALSSIMRQQVTAPKRERYRTLGLFGLIMGLCLIAQLSHPYLPLYAIGYMLGTCLLRAFVVGDEKEEYRRKLEEATRTSEIERANAAYQKVLNTSSIYQSILVALSKDYFNLFYVDLDTDDYIEYGFRTEGGHQTKEHNGKDFFAATMANARSLIHEEDLERFIEAIDKKALLDQVDKNGMFIIQYRLMINGAPTYVNLKAVRATGDDRYLIVGINNIDAQVKDRVAAQRAAEERKSYLRLSALNGNLIVLYYVNLESDHYTEFSATKDYDELGIAKQGEDFFGETYINSLRTIHPDDQELFHSLLTKENVMSTIEQDGVFSFDYRLMTGDRASYVRLKAARFEEGGKPMLIVGLFDEDAQVRLEQEFARNLSAAKRMASIDSLTGVKNKHAYTQWEEKIDTGIDSGEQEPFAVVVCDINGLKAVNDLYGHKEGDACIKGASKRICDVFDHSPVFRVGGDEFVVLLMGQDYAQREELMATISELPEDLDSIRAGDTLSAGMAEYDKDEHASLLSVFEEADMAMYKRKQFVKRLLSANGSSDARE